MKQYLASTSIIDWQTPSVKAKAAELSGLTDNDVDVAKTCYEYVRDEVQHSCDHECTVVTSKASDVLKHRTGYCFALSHLLAALLRANNIPAGLCYQRLSIDAEKKLFCLHGLNAVYLKDFGWYRIDPRGGRRGANAQFCPPKEDLVFSLDIEGEGDLPEIWAEPLPVVVETLNNYKTVQDVFDNLPDVAFINQTQKSCF